jgi:pyroglutamyl-peptidase
VNASGELARELASHARRRFPTVTIACATLPTEWATAPLLLEGLISAHQPDVAIHFGVSHMAEGFVVETSARNCAANADASGAIPLASELLPNQPPERLTTLPVARIVNRLKRMGLPAAVSHDAGAYLCNAVYYHSLKLNSLLNDSAESAFIHLPTTLATRQSPLSFDEALAGGLEIIATALKHPPAERVPTITRAAPRVAMRHTTA